MNEEQRKAHQRHYLECCRQEGWLDEEQNHLWPDDPQARAEMGRGLFGLAFTSGMDSTFQTWEDRASNPEGRTSAVPGSIVDQIDQEWRHGLAAMTQEQRDFVLRIVDDVLNMSAYQFGIMLDRFDHGELSVHLTPSANEGGPEFTVQIQPRGPLEMFQDVYQWREKFGMGTEIGRPASD